MCHPRAFSIVTTIQGSEITFGLDHLDEQLARWREIYDLGSRMNKTIASVDLAVGEQRSGAVDGKDFRTDPGA